MNGRVRGTRLGGYYNFMGWVVDAGEHETYFEFDPESRHYGKRLSVLDHGILVPSSIAAARGGAHSTALSVVPWPGASP